MEGAVGAGHLVFVSYRTDGDMAFFHVMIDFQQFSFHYGEKVFEIFGRQSGGGLGEGAFP